MPVQPSESPIAADAHFGVPAQKSFRSIAASAPPQTIASTGTAQPGESTSSPNGVYVPAIRRYTPM
jgi:hypothetical protein